MGKHQVGMCTKCGERVWLTPDGGCSRGHGSAPITSVEDVAAPATPLPKTVYCRVCGSALFESNSVCGNCGTPRGETPGAGAGSASGAGPAGTPFSSQHWQVGRATIRISATGLAPLTAAPDMTYQDPYYRAEFQAIFGSQEQYRGRWNWAAFIFGPFWLLARDMPLLGALVIVAQIILTVLFHDAASMAILAYHIYLGLRGNYLRYVALYKRVQAFFE